MARTKAAGCYASDLIKLNYITFKFKYDIQSLMQIVMKVVVSESRIPEPEHTEIVQPFVLYRID